MINEVGNVTTKVTPAGVPNYQAKGWKVLKEAKAPKETKTSKEAKAPKETKTK